MCYLNLGSFPASNTSCCTQYRGLLSWLETRAQRDVFPGARSRGPILWNFGSVEKVPPWGQLLQSLSLSCIFLFPAASFFPKSQVALLMSFILNCFVALLLLGRALPSLPGHVPWWRRWSRPQWWTWHYSLKYTAMVPCSSKPTSMTSSFLTTSILEWQEVNHTPPVHSWN